MAICNRCGFETGAVICGRCQIEQNDNSPRPDFAVGVYQGNRIMKGQQPAYFQVWSKFKAEHVDHYTEEQWLQIEAIVRTGKDWIIVGGRKTPAMVISALTEGSRSSASLAAGVNAALEARHAARH